VTTAIDDQGTILSLDDTEVTALPLLDHQVVDWSRVQRTAYLVHQHLRYDYPGPIADLRHQLMIVPPEHFGDQRRVVYQLDVSLAECTRSERLDQFGNVVLEISVPCVTGAIEFDAWIVVERTAGRGPHLLPDAALQDPRYLQPSTLTQPDAALQRAAQEAQRSGASGLALAERLNAWVFDALRYTNGATGVHTTASQALAIGRGVCQDYAHVMLALCRLCGLPARYVSGHLLGEGGTHAWVELLRPAAGHPGMAEAVAFDPTHTRRASLSYLTVAVGRDYLDVPPTSGVYRAAHQGRLSARKRVGIAAIRYAEEEEGER
jgi:transglutaminase-like putative cysteine protease